jgi:hypothetical protein
MERWVVVLLVLVLVMPSALAHKSPVVEYGRAGMWRTAYSFIPRQPVVNEPITITEQVWHLNDTIKGQVNMVFTVYEDDSWNDWFGGKEYKHPNWLVIKNATGVPVPGEEHMYSTDVIIGRPGNYFVTVDLYEDGQYIGQDQRALDVEQQTLGPMFVTFSLLIIGGVLWGVKARVL